MKKQNKIPKDKKPPLPKGIAPPLLPKTKGAKPTAPKPPRPPIPPSLKKGKSIPQKSPTRKPGIKRSGALRVLEVKAAPTSKEPSVKTKRVWLPPVKHHDYMLQVLLASFIVQSLSMVGVIKAVDIFNLKPRRAKIKYLDDAVNRMIAFREKQKKKDDLKDGENAVSDGDTKKKDKSRGEELKDKGKSKGKGIGTGKDKAANTAASRVSKTSAQDFDPDADKGGKDAGVPEKFDIEDKGAAQEADKILGELDDGSGDGSVSSSGTWASSNSGDGSGGPGKGRYSSGNAFGPGAPGAPGSGENIRFKRPKVNLPGGKGPRIAKFKRSQKPKEKVKKKKIGKVKWGGSKVSGQVTNAIKQKIRSVVSAGKGRIRALFMNYSKRGATIEGKLNVMIIISPSGSSSVKAQGSGLPGNFVSAAKAAIASWRFPAPGKRVTLRFSFTFTPM